METALIIVHLVIALILIVVVLLQQGKQAGLSGAVAGGAETFFGKNKGRTVDAMLKKITTVVAVLFIVTSLALAYVASKPAEGEAAEATETTETVEGQEMEITDEQLQQMIESGQIQVEDGAAAEGETAQGTEPDAE